MSLHTMNTGGGWDKTIWILLISTLVYIEIRAIDKDRQERDKQQECIRNEQRRSFKEIIQENKDHFKTSMNTQQEFFNAQQKSFAQIIRQNSIALRRAVETLNIITGDPNTPAYAYYFNFNLATKHPEADLWIVNPSNRYSSYDVQVSGGNFDDGERSSEPRSITPKSRTQFKAGPFSVLHVNFPLLIEAGRAIGNEFIIRNRSGFSYYEQLVILRLPNKVTQAVKVYRSKERTETLFQCADDDFPLHKLFDMPKVLPMDLGKPITTCLQF